MPVIMYKQNLFVFLQKVVTIFNLKFDLFLIQYYNFVKMNEIAAKQAFEYYHPELQGNTCADRENDVKAGYVLLSTKICIFRLLYPTKIG